MASILDNLYVTFVDVDRELLKVWGQRNRISATYIEKQLLQLIPEFRRSQSPNPARIRKGMFCFAKYTDDNYYRARVISDIQGDSVGVLFVDYGNKDLINISNIRIQEGREGEVLAKMAEQAEEYYLARVLAPIGGWTKGIVSEIRRDICCDEFVSKVVDQVGDQKVLEIQYHNQGFSDFLVKKQVARPITLATQKQLILSYCSLVSFDPNQNREMADLNYSKPSLGVPNQGVVKPPQPISMMSEQHEVYNYGKQTNPVNYSQPSASIPAHFAPSRQITSIIQNAPKIVPPRTFYTPPTIPSNHVLRSESQMPPMNPQFSPMPPNQFNPQYQIKPNPEMPLINNVMIEVLAQQIKQYITEDSAKSGSEEEKIPHNYVSSVLEVGSTHNVFVSNIDDGPWSFSIQLLSSESELNKLMEELTLIELIPVKPPLILGHPCIGVSGVYGNLCRGVVVSISHSAVKVYFVDFGSTEDLPVSSLFELPPKFFKTRVLSQKFSLSGLQKVAYSEDIKKCFKEVVNDELLMLRVTSLEGDNLPTCELYHKDRNIKRLLNDKIRDLKSLREEFLKVGDVVDVVVTWVESPQKFFLQLRKKDAELSALKKELANAPRNCQPLTFQELSVGLKCICQYASDEQWYRATITSLKSENAITVFYIDYGNTETVNISLLRKMDSHGLVSQMSVQAVQCVLKGFENKPNDQALSTYLETLILEKDLKMKVVSKIKNCFTVELYDKDEDIGSALLTYAQKLVMYQNKENVSSWKDIGDSSRQTASKSDPKFRYSGGGDSYERRERPLRIETDRPSFSREKSLSSRQFPESDKYQSTHTQSRRRYDDRREDFWKSGDRSLRQDREMNWNERRAFGGNSVGSGSDRSSWNRDRGSRHMEGWTDSKRSDSMDSSDWRDRSSSRWKLEESKGQRKRFDETDKSYGYRDSRPSDLGVRKKYSDDRYASGSERTSVEVKSARHTMRIEELAPAGSVFVERAFQLKHEGKAIVTFFRNPHEFCVQVLDQEEKFKKMMDEIQLYYKDKYSLKDPVNTGDIVIAEFSEDKVLYRGQIIRSAPETVRFVDYGNTEVIRPRTAWAVAKQFLKLPKQAVKCRLAKIKPVGSEWPSPETDLGKFFEYDEYQIKFLDVANGVYEVKMTITESGKDLAREIIAAGLGLPDIKKRFLAIKKVDFKLLPRQLLRLLVTHVESSLKFYVILNPLSVRSIEREIKLFTEDEENLKPLEESCLQPGTKCLSTSDDVVWHRGTITEVIDNRVILRFDDRGDSVNVTADKVMEIPGYLTEPEPQAFECCLDGVSDELTPSEEEEFKNSVERKYHFFLIRSHTGQRLSVVLYDLLGRKSNLQRKSKSPQTVEPLAQLPILSQGISVDISHIESPQELYIQRTVDWDAIESISQQLSEYYEDNNEEDEFGVEKKEGMLVAAKSVEHEAWYRGRIMSLYEDGADIFYIDYGNTETLPIQNVKKLDFVFNDFHLYASKVSLPVKFDPNLKSALNTSISKIFNDKNSVAYFRNDKGKFYADFVVGGKLLRDEWKSMDGITPVYEMFKDILPDDNPPTVEPVTEKATVVTTTKTETTPPSSSRNVFVSHIDSPKQFWVHQEGSIHELNSLQEDLERQCQKSAEKEKCQAGEVVGVHYSGIWYRAEVIEAEGKKLTVKFIDYGNVLVVDSTKNPVKELTPELCNVPIFASRYSLKGTWDDSFTAKFEEIIMQLEDPVKAVILEDGDPKIVDLFRNGESIAEKLIEGGSNQVEGDSVYIVHSNSPADFYIHKESCAEALDKLSSKLSEPEKLEDASFVQENEIYAAKFPEDESWYRARVIKKGSDRTEVFFIDYGNTSNVTELKRLPEDVLDIPILSEHCCLLNGKNSDVWSERACEKFSEYCDGRSLKMKVVVKKGKKSVVKLFFEDTNITDELDGLCEADGRKDVYISHVNSPTDFYIQFVNDEDFKKVMDVLEKEDCENLEDRKPGTLCQACFDVDGLWYRAKILQNLGEKCEVFFIDYGNVSTSTNLKKLPPEIEKIPPRALKCSLNLPETNIPESVKEEFITLTTDGLFRAKIITPGDVNIVSLKLNGRILEETLFSDGIPERNNTTYDDLPRPADVHGPLDDETDDDKNSKKIGMSEHYISSNVEDDVMAGSSVRNETDEEKRVKIAIGVVDGGLEGFKSDDEKGISESGILSSMVNVTDNELIEESQENVEESTNDTQSNDRNGDTTEEQEVSNELSAENDTNDENPVQEPQTEIKTETKDTCETSTSAEGTASGSQPEGNKDETLPPEENGEESTNTVTKEQQSEDPSGETTGEVSQ